MRIYLTHKEIDGKTIYAPDIDRYRNIIRPIDVYEDEPYSEISFFPSRDFSDDLVRYFQMGINSKGRGKFGIYNLFTGGHDIPTSMIKERELKEKEETELERIFEEANSLGTVGFWAIKPEDFGNLDLDKLRDVRNILEGRLRCVKLLSEYTTFYDKIYEKAKLIC